VFLLSGGSGIALFPLAVNQMFDHINERQAMSATSTMQILLGVGAIIGPIVAGFLMSQLGVIWLYWYLIIVHSLLIVFLVVRKLFVRTERLEPAANYQVTMQSTAVSSQMDSVDAK
ncbi:MAG TPA: transmembrane transport protein, partial [Oceanospirillaceae bacterium]|nr:transmembrane transport protein [Oceanospirillaceae bacterium]